MKMNHKESFALGWATGALSLTLFACFMVGCTQSHNIEKTVPVEQAPLPRAKEVFNNYGNRIIRLCDEGNMIYFSPSGEGKGLAVIPGGCR